MQNIEITKTVYERGTSKYNQVRQIILEYVETHNLTEGYRFPNVDELARIFNVSRVTANHAMEELAREGIVERMPGIGSILKKRPCKDSVGILLPSLLLMEKENNQREWFVLQQVMQGVMKGLSSGKIQWEVLELSNLQSVSKKIDRILDKKIKGLLFLNSLMLSREEELLKSIELEGIPFVIAYNIHEIYQKFPCVFVDKVAGFKKGLRHLIEHGHKKIAFVGGADPAEYPKIIPSAYSQVFAEKGWEVDEKLIWSESEIPRFKEKISETGVTALYFMRDIPAIETIDTLKDAGIRVGRDISIVGYDNIAESSHCVPSLTTIEPHRTIAGYYSAKMLLSKMNKKPAETIRLVPDIVIRESCGCKK